MFRKNYLIGFLTVAIFLIGGAVAAFAQTTAPVTGRVVLKGADASAAPTPVEGALVELYRVDIKGKPLSDTTDKKGNFSFAGVAVGQVFVMSVSGPGLEPVIIPNFKAGMENQLVTVAAGDGKKYTEDEVRQAIVEAGKTQQTPQSSEEQKKAEEEYKKKVAEVTAKNEKIKNQTAAVQKALDEGNAAFNSKNFDVAVVKYEEGFQANPDFVGSAPVLLNNKGAALKQRAVVVFNENAKKDKAAQDAAKVQVRKDLADAAESYNKSWEILKSAPATDINDPKTHEANKINALNGAKDTFRIMAITRTVDTTKSEIAKSLLTEYVAIETDQAKKVEAQRILGDIYAAAGDLEAAIAEYKKVLESSPNDPDALAGAGLNLSSVAYLTMEGGDTAKGKEQYQEAANYLQRFVDVAPSNHKLLESIKDSLEDIKSAQNITPQKGKTTPTNTRKKN